MNRRFSLATLMLIIAIAAVESAALRMIYERFQTDKPLNTAPDWTAFQVATVSGFFLGGTLGLALAIRNRSGWLRGIASTVAGCALGIGSGAQCTVPMDWGAMLAAPIIVIPLTLLIAINGRRRSARRAALAVQSP